MNSIVKPFDELEDHYDVVVVGSGYGGGVAASRLAQMGFKVCVLEKGRQWRPGDFSNSVTGLWARSRLMGKYVKLGRANALFDLRVGKQMHVLTGCGLGGGSLVNAGLAFEPDDWVFEQECWPKEIRVDGGLIKGFQRAKDMLGVAHCPNGAELLKFKSLQECARELGASAELVPSTINYTPGFNKANVMQSACTQCGDCWMGCNVGAKNTVALTYLAKACQFGASLFTNMSVSFIRKRSKGWFLYTEQLDDKSGKIIGHRSLTADRVVLSAGVLGTSEILMRSQQHGLVLSEQIGKGVSANGDDLAFGHDMPQKVNGIAVGHPGREVLSEPVGPNCIGMISLQEKGDPKSTIKLQAGTMTTMMAALAPLKSLLRGKPIRALKILLNGAYKGVLTRSQCFYIVGHDEANGELVFDGKRVLLQWPDVAGQPVFNQAKERLTKLFAKIGADYMQNPVRDTILGGKLITVHPLGGCRMGETAASGVVDHCGRVFAPSKGKDGDLYESLHVLDGSIIPTSLGANPLLTITALAERSMDLMAQEQGLEIDDRPLKAATVRDAFM